MSANGSPDEPSSHLFDLAVLGLSGQATSRPAGHGPVFLHDAIVAGVLRCQPLARQCDVGIATDLLEVSNHDAALEVEGDRSLLEAMVENAVRQLILVSLAGTSVHLHVRVLDDVILLSLRAGGASSAWSGPQFRVPASMPGVADDELDMAINVAVSSADHDAGDGPMEFRIGLRRWPQRR